MKFLVFDEQYFMIRKIRHIIMLNYCNQVTNRVNEVDDHLNYLLGRLSLVVQEFNQVRSGLGEALEAMRLGIPGSETSVTEASDLNDIPRKEQLDTHDEEEDGN